MVSSTFGMSQYQRRKALVLAPLPRIVTPFFNSAFIMKTPLGNQTTGTSRVAAMSIAAWTASLESVPKTICAWGTDLEAGVARVICVDDSTLVMVESRSSPPASAPVTLMALPMSATEKRPLVGLMRMALPAVMMASSATRASAFAPRSRTSIRVLSILLPCAAVAASVMP